MQKQKILVALKKAHTGLGRIIGEMEKVDEKKSKTVAQNRCFEVLQQTLAVIGLIKSANTLILASHIDAVFAGSKTKTMAEKEKLRNELVKILKSAQK